MLAFVGVLFGLILAGWCLWSECLRTRVFCPVEGGKCRYKKVKLGEETAYVFPLRPGDRVVAVIDGQLISAGVNYSRRFGQKVCRELINQELNQSLKYCFPLDPEKTSFIKPQNIARGALLWQADQGGELVIWGNLKAVWRQ